MSPRLAEALERLPELLSAHIVLSFSALALGAAISLPLGVALAHRPRAAAPVVGFASVVQTVPGIALLALMVPLLGGRIGFVPAFIALVLYSMLPILRNAIVGVAGVEPAVREAARAVGMTARQRLLQVELPLAAPVILAGLRTATVWVVGAATLATPVGATSLGNFIFSGLQTRNWTAVLVGCAAAAALALIADRALALFERAALNRAPRQALAPAGLVALVALAAVWPALSSATATASGGTAPRAAISASRAATLDGRTVRIGAKTFTEQFVLARLIAAELEVRGAAVEIVEGLGSTIAFDALKSGEIDVYVDYTGTLWATVLNETEPAPRATMVAAMTGRLFDEHDVVLFGRLGFENAYAFAARRDVAAARGWRSIEDLAPDAAGLEKGGDPEFFGRPEWRRVRDAYGLGAIGVRDMQSTLMYGAVESGAVDVITAYTTDGRIDAYDLVLLDDPLGVLPPYEAVVLLSRAAADDAALADALRPFLGAISPEMMRAANGRVDLDAASTAEAAAWLGAQIRGE